MKNSKLQALIRLATEQGITTFREFSKFLKLYHVEDKKHIKAIL